MKNTFKQSYIPNICKKNFYHNNILIFKENKQYECVHTSSHIITVKPDNNINPWTMSSMNFNFYIHTIDNPYQINNIILSPELKLFNKYFCNNIKELRKEKLNKINEKHI